ncbi:MAG: H-NS family nucleoid-associated regulatory protein [Thiolinea sp.]
MTAINLDKLSVEQLENLKSGIDAAIERQRNIELMAMREQVDALVDASPFSLEEILEARPPRQPVAPKYQHPDDSTLTWTGRGRKPLWVIEHLEKGQSIETLAIATN